MKVTLKSVLVAMMIVFCVEMAYAEEIQEDDYVQQFDNGEINWKSGRVTAKGIGAPPPGATNIGQARALGLRAATVVARRNILELIKGVQIDSDTTVQNFMVADDTVVSRVRGFLQNSKVLDTSYMSDGSVEVTVVVALRDAFANALIPKTTIFKKPVSKRVAQKTSPAPVKKSAPPEKKKPSRPAVPGGVTAMPVMTASAHGDATGLVVDARGLGVRPAMSPRIIDENGNVLYGSAKVSREYALKQGMAGYAKDIGKATQNPRVAGNPFVAKAVKVTGKSKTDIVLSNSDAQRLRELTTEHNFLEKCRVMVVLD